MAQHAELRAGRMPTAASARTGVRHARRFPKLRPTPGVLWLALVFALVVPAAAEASAYFEAASATPSLVSYWRLGEEQTSSTAVDTEERNHGTYNGGVTKVASGLVPNSANTGADFDGATGRVDIPDSNTLDISSAITIEACVRPAALGPASGTIIRKEGAYLLRAVGTTAVFRLWVNGTIQELRVDDAFAVGRTDCLAATYDRATMRLYRNGVQIGSRAQSGPIVVNSKAAVIGGYGGSNQLFSGVIDEVALFNAALGATEIRDRYDIGQTASRTPGFHGAQTHPFWSDTNQAQYTQELDKLRAAGGNTVRIDLSWSSMELDCNDCYSPGYVAKVDDFMAAAAARGIKVLPAFLNTPCWASSAPAELKQECEGTWWSRGVTAYPPTDMQDYADAARYAVDRWGQYLAGFQIWNEPNEANHQFWKTTDHAGDYVRLVQAAYPAIKGSTHPDTTVVVGALSRADGVFTRELYENGIEGHFDAFSIHPYTEARTPYESRRGDSRKYSFISGVPWVREVMTSYGDPKPIWLTEFGYTSCNDPDNTLYCISEDLQARRTAESWQLLKSYPYVEAAVQYNLRNKLKDGSPDLADREANFGLLTRDFTEKPAYAAFSAAQSAAAPDDGPKTTGP
jgi:hypothetical protein